MSMARVPLINATDPGVDPTAAAILTAAAEQPSGVLNVHRALANHPQIMERFFGLAEVAYFANSIGPARSELAYLTAAMQNDCHY
jgi:alkylhydroperoxidase family enzyme